MGNLASQDGSVETRSAAVVDRLTDSERRGLRTCSIRHVEISDELRSVLESAIDPGFQWLELRGVGR